MGMGRFPGVHVEDDAYKLNDSGQLPQEVGEIRRNGGDLFAQDSLGVFNLRQQAATGDFVIVRQISATVVVATGTTRLHRETQIADGVEVTLEAGGELLVL